MHTDFPSHKTFVLPPAKQRVVFGMMTDPNPNHEIAFALRDRTILNPSAG
jgi:hypothetical protein